jgi:putative salt-induced outer membrane protein YdiY
MKALTSFTSSRFRRVAALSAMSFAVCALAQAAEPAPAPPAAPELTEEQKKTDWATSASLGLTLTRGNSETLLFTGNVLSEKKWEQNEVRLGINATYGEDRDEKNAESLQGFGQFNRLFTDRFYGYLRAEALHDAIADVEYRITLSPGVGYYFIKNERTTLSGEVGPGFIMEKQGGDTREYLSLRLAERLEHKINDRVRVWQSLEFLPQVDDWENFIINGEVGIDTKITEKLSLRVFAVDTYDNEPAPGRKENDLKLVTAVGYTF